MRTQRTRPRTRSGSSRLVARCSPARRWTRSTRSSTAGSVSVDAIVHRLPLRYGRGMLRELKRLRERTMSPSMTTSCPTTWRMARSASQAGWESTTVVWPLTFRLAAWRPVPVPATMWPRLTLEGLVLMTRAMLTSGPTMTAMKTTAATATTAAS